MRSVLGGLKFEGIEELFKYFRLEVILLLFVSSCAYLFLTNGDFLVNLMESVGAKVKKAKKRQRFYKMKGEGEKMKTHAKKPKNGEEVAKNLAEINSKNRTGVNNWEKFLGMKMENKPVSMNKKHKPLQESFVIGMDCEMVGIGKDGKDSMLARVSLVDIRGDCIYDKYVIPRETITDYRTHVSGIRESDLVNAEPFEVVQKEVANLLKKRILVGHGLKNDMEVLFLKHPRHSTRDTSIFFKRNGKGTPSLKKLALEYLNTKIQDGEHSSIQDARAAVQLYNLYKKKWEQCVKLRKPARIDTKLEKHKEKEVKQISDEVDGLSI